MPTLLITRRLPPEIEARAAQAYTVRGNAEDRRLDGAQIVALAAGADAVLCCPAETLGPATIAALPASVRVLGTFSVGTDHIAMDAARARGLAVVNTPDVLSRATAGVYKKTLVFSMPGSPNAVQVALEKLIIPEINHLAWEIVRKN